MNVAELNMFNVESNNLSAISAVGTVVLLSVQTLTYQ